MKAILPNRKQKEVSHGEGEVKDAEEGDSGDKGTIH